MTVDLAPVLQFFKNVMKIIAFAYIYQLAMFSDLTSCVSKDIQKCIQSHVLVPITTSQIWQITGWLKIQKLESLENGTYFFYEIKKFFTCASDDMTLGQVFSREYCAKF